MRLLEVFALFKLFNLVNKLDADSLLSVLTPISTYDRTICLQQGLYARARVSWHNFKFYRLS